MPKYRIDGELGLRANTEQFKSEMRSSTLATARAQKAMAKYQKEMAMAARRAERFRKAITRVVSVFALFYIAQRAVRALSGALNELQAAANKIRVVTTSEAELVKVQEDLFDIAQRARTPWIELQKIYGRVAIATNEMGISSQRLTGFIESLSKAATASGVNAQEMRAGLIQLSQGLGAGALRGDEFRSVMENLPFIARKIASGLKVSVGELRELSRQGELTTEVIFTAIEKSAGEIDEFFDSTQVTISQATEIVRNEGKKLVAAIDEVYEPAKAFTDLLLDTADFIKSIRESELLTLPFENTFQTIDDPLQLEQVRKALEVEKKKIEDLILDDDGDIRLQYKHQAVLIGIENEDNPAFGEPGYGGYSTAPRPIYEIQLSEERQQLNQINRDLENIDKRMEAIREDSGIALTEAQREAFYEKLGLPNPKDIDFGALDKATLEAIVGYEKLDIQTRTAARKAYNAIIKEEEKLAAELEKRREQTAEKLAKSLAKRRSERSASTIQRFNDAIFLSRSPYSFAERRRRADEARFEAAEIEAARQRGLYNEARRGEELERFYTDLADRERELLEQWNEAMEERKKQAREVTQEFKRMGDTIAADIVGGLREGASAADVLASVINRLLDKLLETAVIDPLGSIIGNALQGAFAAFGSPAPINNQFSNIGSGFSGGRVASGGLVRVGEAGPEVIALPQGAEIYPRGDLSDDGGGGITINVYGTRDETETYNAIMAAGEQIKQDVLGTLVRDKNRPGLGRNL